MWKYDILTVIIWPITYAYIKESALCWNTDYDQLGNDLAFRELTFLLAVDCYMAFIGCGLPWNYLSAQWYSMKKNPFLDNLKICTYIFNLTMSFHKHSGRDLWDLTMTRTISKVKIRGRNDEIPANVCKVYSQMM